MADRTDQALTEYSLGFEGLLLAQHMEHGTSQLVGDRFDGYDRVRLRRFPIVIALRLRVVTNREVRSFDEGPGQVAIPVFAVVVGFLLSGSKKGQASGSRSIH